MKVALLFGAGTLKIHNTFKQLVDDTDFSDYRNIDEFIRECELRHKVFDRVILSSVALSDVRNDLSLLNEFCKSNMSSTSVIFIFKETAFGTDDKIFNELFNSPIYTPICLISPAKQVLKELLYTDISELRYRYYTLVTDKLVSRRSKEKSDSSNTTKSTAKKPKLFGGVGLFQKKDKVDGSDAEKSIDEGNEISVNNENGVKDGTDEGINKDVQGTGNMFDNVGSPNTSKGSDLYPQEDIELGLGEIGGDHEDTGFLDDNEESLLNDFMKEENEGTSSFEKDDSVGKDASNVGDVWVNDSISKGTETVGMEDGEVLKDVDVAVADVSSISDIPKVEQRKPTVRTVKNGDTSYKNHTRNTGSSGIDVLNSELSKVENQIKQDEIRNTNIRSGNTLKSRKKTELFIMTGLSGTGITQFIIDTAVSYLEKYNSKILIVDADYDGCGVLSYIDVDEFYRQGMQNGISEGMVFSEEGVDIASQGYGNILTEDDLYNFICDAESSSNGYDIIFIDCPLEKINLLSERLLDKCLTSIIVNGRRADLISASICLTDRSKVSLGCEKRLMNNSKVKIINSSDFTEDDLYFVASNCIFANGNWLSEVIK